jgi:HEAT repeat protein
MQHRTESMMAVVALLLTSAVFGQSNEDKEELQIAAIEALISAPPERAMPIVTRVLQGDYDAEVKENALFIASQIDTEEAQNLLLETARTSSGDLQEEAIVMIGIGGGEAALAGLGELYASGDGDVRESVLEAYMIAGDSKAIYDIAANATSADEFEDAVEMLAAMGAMDELRELKVNSDMSKGMAHAFAIAGDLESVREMALDQSDPDAQVEAIGALGLIGNDEANATLMQMYRQSDDDDVREAALEGMLISGYDEGVLELYRTSQNNEEKRELLEYLSYMESDEIWNVIDEALENR